MWRTGRPTLRFVGRFHALGHAPQVRVPRPGSRGSGWVGRVPPHAGVRRPGLQPAGQGHHDDRPRRAGRAGISEVVRVRDVHLTDASIRSDGRGRCFHHPTNKQQTFIDDRFFCEKLYVVFACFECQMPCNLIQRLPPCSLLSPFHRYVLSWEVGTMKTGEKLIPRACASSATEPCTEHFSRAAG